MADGADNGSMDINGAGFDAEAYVQRLIQNASLSQLMSHEGEVVKQIHSLDSDMQTLVYENYNKFIAATDTIRQMRVDFRGTDAEVDLLAAKMQAVAVRSARVSEALKDRRRRAASLSGTHALLKKLQFLFELPAKLRECCSAGGSTPDLPDLARGVRYYLGAQRVLEQYQHLASFRGIKADCDATVLELRSALLDRLRSSSTSSRSNDMADCVRLLLDLDEPPDQLCADYLAAHLPRLSGFLDSLDRQNQLFASLLSREKRSVSESGDVVVDGLGGPHPMDILEYVDHGCNNFLSETCLMVASYCEAFVSGENRSGKVDPHAASEQLGDSLRKLMGRFFDLLRIRTSCCTSEAAGTPMAATTTTTATVEEDTLLLARALDRFYRRLQAMCRLLPAGLAGIGEDFIRRGLDLVSEAAEVHCGLILRSLTRKFDEDLVETRKNLAVAIGGGLGQSRDDVLLPGAAAGDPSSSSSGTFPDMNRALLGLVSDELRQQLVRLQAFVDPELTFASKSRFRTKFCHDYVRDGLVAGHFRAVLQVGEDLCLVEHPDQQKLSSSLMVQTPPALLLLLSKTFLDIKASTVPYTLGHVEDLFPATGAGSGGRPYGSSGRSATTTALLAEELREGFGQTAQKLLNAFVRRQGQVVSTMLRKSIETRDWLNTVEPRTVRAAMKRVVEEVTVIDQQVGALYEDGHRKQRSSDSSSSRRTTAFSGGSGGGHRKQLQIQHGSRTTGGWSTALAVAAAAAQQHHQQQQQQQQPQQYPQKQQQLSSNLASNIQKMFNEKIEIFSPVGFSKVSVLTGVVKVALKTMLECVRLRTFSRYGFQQMQVDCQYLYLYLWRFVSDENLVTFLLDEILSSTVHRCLEPTPMESSVVEVICDRG